VSNFPDESQGLRDRAGQLIDGIDTFINAMSIGDSITDYLAAVLTLTIAEQFHSMLTLLDHDRGSHAAAGPVRSMLENVADLILLSADPGYAWQIAFDNANADTGVLERVIAAVGDSALEVVPKTIYDGLAQFQESKAWFKAKGMKRQSREDKFALTGRKELYLAYGVLCSLVHPNLLSLVERHGIDKSQLRYRSEPRPEFTHLILTIGVMVLSDAAKILPSFSDVSADQVDLLFR
jgi:hypothetical protein